MAELRAGEGLAAGTLEDVFLDVVGQAEAA
jgi:hypothetical protein